MADTNLANWQGAVDDQLDFGKKAYLEAIPDLATANATATGAAEMQGGAAAGQANLAKTLAGRVDKFAGMQDQYAQDAADLDSPENQSKVAGEAVAGVTQQFKNLRDQNTRQLMRTGVNPNSGRALALGNQLGMAEAVARAGSAAKARNDLSVVADDRQKTAIGFGSNLPGQSTSAAQQAGYLGNTAVESAKAPLANRLNFAGGISNIYGNAQGGYGDLWKSNNLTAAQRAQTDSQEDSNLWGALGSIVGSKGGSDLISKGADWVSKLF
jgi:hypothetical protein